MDITVLTAVIGGCDTLQPAKGRSVCYTDTFRSDDWEIRKAHDYGSPRFSSRVYKILAHKFVSAEYIVWVDGQIGLKQEPEALVELLGEEDVAFFTHPQREVMPFTWEDEMETCLMKGLIEPKLAEEQRAAYRDLPKGHIYYGGVIIRRTTPKATRLFEEWWAEYCRFPTRDQLSLFKVFQGKCKVIEEKVGDNQYIHYAGHGN